VLDDRADQGVRGWMRSSPLRGSTGARMLDTDTCIRALRQNPGMVQRLSRVRPAGCAISMVTAHVIY
jgi:hypothetical protein